MYDSQCSLYIHKYFLYFLWGPSTLLRFFNKPRAPTKIKAPSEKQQSTIHSRVPSKKQRGKDVAEAMPTLHNSQSTAALRDQSLVQVKRWVQAEVPLLYLLYLRPVVWVGGLVIRWRTLCTTIGRSSWYEGGVLRTFMECNKLSTDPNAKQIRRPMHNTKYVIMRALGYDRHTQHICSKCNTIRNNYDPMQLVIFRVHLTLLVYFEGHRSVYTSYLQANSVLTPLPRDHSPIQDMQGGSPS